MAKSVLFISHDASRTGAPIILLNFLKWFKENSDIPFQILLGRGGELESEFRAIAPVTIFSDYEKLFHKSIKTRLINRINNLMGLHLDKTNGKNTWISQKLEKDIKANAGINSIDLVYSNTITNGSILEHLSMMFTCPIISHIHELEWNIQYFGLEAEKTKKYSSHYIAVSEAVRQNLIHNNNISEKQVSLIHEFIPNNISVNQLEPRQKICSQLGIPENSLIVGGAGNVHWRKGVDLFIQVADIVSRKKLDLPVHFLWLGKAEGIYYQQLRYDIKKLGIEKIVHFLGNKTNPLYYLSTYDIFILTSREDPFPLVCLESASLGKPIICFDQAGGIKELVENDCGFVVPYLDINAMALKSIQLLSDQQLRYQFGQCGQEKVQELYTLEVSSKKILNLIQQFLLE